MTQQKIGPREQQLRTQREAAEAEHAKKKRPPDRSGRGIPEEDRNWKLQLRAIKGNAKRKDRRK